MPKLKLNDRHEISIDVFGNMIKHLDCNYKLKMISRVF